MQDLSKRARAIIAAVAAAILAAGVTVALSIDTDPGGKPRGTVTIHLGSTVHVDGADPNAKPDQAIELSPAAKAQAERLLEQNAQRDDEHELDGPLREPGDGLALRHEPGTPLAAQEFPGCRTAFVNNSSSRGGQTPRVIVWHYTVSHRVAGWADNDALTAMANRLSSGVSWHFSIGGDDGNCAFNVPLNLKAWTQANANPFSIGIEVIDFGDEAHYVEGAGRAKLLSVTRELGRRYKIPMQRGVVRDCSVVKPGIVAHADLGVCGGGHFDIGPKWMGELPGLISAAAAGASSSSPSSTAASDRRRLTKGERANVACLEGQRRIAKRNGGWDKIAPSHLAKASKCKGELRARRATLKRLGLKRPHRTERYRELGRVIRG